MIHVAFIALVPAGGSGRAQQFWLQSLKVLKPAAKRGFSPDARPGDQAHWIYFVQP